jgi:hypothetical protein
MRPAHLFFGSKSLGNLIDALDSALVQPKNAALTALPLEIRLQLVPCAEIFAAIVAPDFRFRVRVHRYPKPDRQAVGAFKLVIEILGRHRLPSLQSDDGMPMWQSRITPP